MKTIVQWNDSAKVRMTNAYSGSAIEGVMDWASAQSYACQFAAQHNYGLFRSWMSEGKVFIDCGPRTFCIELV